MVQGTNQVKGLTHKGYKRSRILLMLARSLISSRIPSAASELRCIYAGKTYEYMQIGHQHHDLNHESEGVEWLGCQRKC